MSTALLILRKPTGTIQLSNPFGLGERKLLNTLMYHAQASGRPLGEEHEITLPEVQEALGWTRSKNVEKLQEYLRTLLGTVIEWNEFGEDRSFDWVACQFLSSGAIRGQRVRYMINPKIVTELRNPALYAKVQLLVQGRLSKRHSLVLYEYFQDALGRRLSLDAVPVDFLVSLLGLSGETYRQFKYLRRDVLEPSLREINCHTDLDISYTPVRKGRQTVALDFVIARDESFQLAFDLPADGGAPDEAAPAAGFGTLLAALARHGVTRGSAEKLCERHAPERIVDHVLLLERKLAAGASIDNPGAWLRRAIENNWAAHAGAGADAGAASDGDPAPAPAASGADEKAFQSFRLARAREALAARTKTFRTRRRNAFVADMEADGNTTVLEAIRKNGWDHAMVFACFVAHGSTMDDLLAEPHERNIDAWLAWRASSGGADSEAGTRV